jgi:LysM repeat protein
MYIAYSNSNGIPTASKPLFVKPTIIKKPTSQINRIFNKKIYKLVAIILVLSLIFSFGAFVQAYAGNGDSEKINNSTLINPASTAIANAPIKVVVQSGDTLWDIASEHMSNKTNIRSYINQIKEMNALSSSMLQEGDVLLLPQ